MRQTHRSMLPFMLLLTATPALGQQNCASTTLTPAKSITDQIVAFLADQKVSIAVDVIGFIAGKENPKLAGIGKGLSLARDLAVYVQNLSGNKPATIQLCAAPRGVTSPSGSPLSLIGMSADIHKVLGTSSNITPAELLMPYQNASANVIPGLKLPALSANFRTQELPPLPNHTPLPLRLNPVAATFLTQGTVSGMVLDEHGNPVSGAIVTLVPSSISTAQPQWRMTSDNGAYSFMDAPGAYSISARLNSSLQEAELRGEPRTVSLAADSPRSINFVLHPPVRAALAAEEQVSPEERATIIDFIAAADRSETQASLDGDSRYLENFYAGEALDRVRQNFAKDRQAAIVSQLANGRVRHIRYLPATFRIEVDTVEVWTRISYNPGTRQEISRKTGPDSPQTISIQQTPRGWYITNVQFQKNVQSQQ